MDGKQFKIARPRMIWDQPKPPGWSKPWKRTVSSTPIAPPTNASQVKPMLVHRINAKEEAGIGVTLGVTTRPPPRVPDDDESKESQAFATQLSNMLIITGEAGEAGSTGDFQSHSASDSTISADSGTCKRLPIRSSVMQVPVTQRMVRRKWNRHGEHQCYIGILLALADGKLIQGRANMKQKDGGDPQLCRSPWLDLPEIFAHIASSPLSKDKPTKKLLIDMNHGLEITHKDGLVKCHHDPKGKSLYALTKIGQEEAQLLMGQPPKKTSTTQAGKLAQFRV